MLYYDDDMIILMEFEFYEIPIDVMNWRGDGLEILEILEIVIKIDWWGANVAENLTTREWWGLNDIVQ